MGKALGNMRFKNKIYLYFLITIIIPVILLGTYSYQTYTKALSKEVNSSVEDSLNQLKLRMDTTLNYIRKYYIEASSKEEMTWLLGHEIKNSDYSELVKAQKMLSCSEFLSDYVSGYTFINRETNRVLSNRGMFTYDEVINQDDVEQYIDGTSNWVNRMDEKSGRTLRRETVDLEGVLYYQNLPLTQAKKHSLLIVNVNLEKINSVVLAENDNCDITIFDQNNKLVYTSNHTVAQALSDQRERLNLETKFDLSLEDGSSYRIGAKASNIMNWTYIIAWNLDVANEGAGNIALMTFTVIFVGMLLMFLIWLFTDVIYRPVSKLRDYADGAIKSYGIVENSTEVPHKSTAGKDDFKLISGNIDCLVDSHVALIKQLEAQEAQLSEFFLTRLINGNLKTDQIDSYIKKLGISLKQHYMVMTVSLQNLSEDTFDEAKQDALRLEVAEQIPIELRKTFLLEPSCNAKVITIVISEDDKKELEKRVIEVYKGLDIFVQMQYEFSIKVGISGAYQDLKQFRNAHHEGIEALKNNEILHHKNESTNFEGVMFFTDIAAKNAESQDIDRLIEKEMKEAVDNADLEKAFQLTCMFIDQLVLKKIAMVERQFYLQHFMNEILTVPLEAGIAIDQIFDHETGNIFQSMQQLYDSEKLKNFYKYRIVTPIIDYLKAYRTSKSSQIIKEIMALIDEKQGDITLAECADKLNYHTTYIWKIMKVEKNITFSDYIAKYKINQAKELLTNTAMTVNDIAAKLNYTNAQNFIRFFSKIEGVTPGKYREHHKYE